MARPPRIIPVSDLRQKTSDILKELAAGDPVFITQRGRAAAVLVSMRTYEHSQHELDILRLLSLGEKEIDAGAGHELNAVLEEADRFLETA